MFNPGASKMSCFSTSNTLCSLFSYSKQFISSKKGIFLGIGLVYLVYSGKLPMCEILSEKIQNPWIKIGALFVTCMIFGIFYCTNSIFKRPCNVFWRGVKGGALFYILILMAIFMTEKEKVREFMKIFDENLGQPLPERSYATACELTVENVRNQLDIFVPLHLFGWFFKALILRDEILCWCVSVFFEFLEYSFAHQLKNFNECWWDHWILDVLLCNWMGIVLGKKFIDRFKLKKYTFFNKKMNLRQAILVLWALAVILLLEMNAFYLKALIWLPTANVLNFLRLLLVSLLGSISMRELFQISEDYLSNKKNTAQKNEKNTQEIVNGENSKEKNQKDPILVDLDLNLSNGSANDSTRKRLDSITITTKAKPTKNTEENPQKNCAEVLHEKEEGQNCTETPYRPRNVLQYNLFLLIAIVKLEFMIIFKYSRGEFHETMPGLIKDLWCAFFVILCTLCAVLYRKNGF